MNKIEIQVVLWEIRQKVGEPPLLSFREDDGTSGGSFTAVGSPEVSYRAGDTFRLHLSSHADLLHPDEESIFGSFSSLDDDHRRCTRTGLFSSRNNHQKNLEQVAWLVKTQREELSQACQSNGVTKEEVETYLSENPNADLG